MQTQLLNFPPDSLPDNIGADTGASGIWDADATVQELQFECVTVMTKIFGKGRIEQVADDNESLVESLPQLVNNIFSF